MLKKIFYGLLAASWIALIIILTYKFSKHEYTNMHGLFVMLIGYFILLYSKRKFLNDKKYWWKFGFMHIEGEDRHWYFLACMLFYAGFVICFI